MSSHPLEMVFLGLSITSSWGNGHASTYRSLVRELRRAGHRVLFLERDVPWYAQHRDLPRPPFCRTELYSSLAELDQRFREEVRRADLVLVGSYVPDGIAVGEWVLGAAAGRTAFYDIDTPVTLAQLSRGACPYLARDQVARYDLYLSFTGGHVLSVIERELGARAARPLYCGCDPEVYRPEPCQPRWDLGYLGTFSQDRQARLDALLLEPARRWPAGRFAVAGAQYPAGIEWPGNVFRVDHLPPAEHARFYASQRFALNVTRADMVRAGWSPSVRIFEAAACGTPVVSDRWPGIETFFEPGQEILIADSAEESLAMLRELPESARREIGLAARRRVLREHTAAHRVRALEEYLQ